MDYDRLGDLTSWKAPQRQPYVLLTKLHVYPNVTSDELLSKHKTIDNNNTDNHWR